jgi:hypothetical protein
VKGFAMSLFSKILDKLGLRKDKEEPATAGTARPAKKPTDMTYTPAKSSGTSAKPAAGANQGAKENVAVRGQPAAATPPAPKAISEVDVVKQLEQKAKGTGLNWKQSISDLLFLLDIDNSRAAREELAKELGAPADVMSDNVRMNTWLHKTVLRKIAENGGNIPQELLD